MTTKNNRLKYMKPAMQVFELRQQPQLLAGSAGLNDYNWNTPDEE